MFGVSPFRAPGERTIPIVVKEDDRSVGAGSSRVSPHPGGNITGWQRPTMTPPEAVELLAMACRTSRGISLKSDNPRPPDIDSEGEYGALSRQLFGSSGSPIG